MKVIQRLPEYVAGWYNCSVYRGLWRSGMSKEEFGHNTDQILIQLVGAKRNVKGSWPLATFRGGLDKVRVSRTGSTTTIKIASRDAIVWTDDWEREKPQRRKARSPQPVAANAKLG
jgi:hypothetical protein